MLRRYKTETRPGLVASLYDIRSGNGVDQFLQARSPHGATTSVTRPCFTTQHQSCKTKTNIFGPRPVLT